MVWSSRFFFIASWQVAFWRKNHSLHHRTDGQSPGEFILVDSPESAVCLSTLIQADGRWLLAASCCFSSDSVQFAFAGATLVVARFSPSATPHGQFANRPYNKPGFPKTNIADRCPGRV